MYTGLSLSLFYIIHRCSAVHFSLNYLGPDLSALPAEVLESGMLEDDIFRMVSKERREPILLLDLPAFERALFEAGADPTKRGIECIL